LRPGDRLGAVTGVRVVRSVGGERGSSSRRYLADQDHRWHSCLTRLVHSLLPRWRSLWPIGSLEGILPFNGLWRIAGEELERTCESSCRTPGGSGSLIQVWSVSSGARRATPRNRPPPVSRRRSWPREGNSGIPGSRGQAPQDRASSSSSNWSIVSIACWTGSGVVISTPASCSNSMDGAEEPQLRNFK
jgi:hypothetical protein